MAVRKKGATASREIAIYLRLSSADGTEAESNVAAAICNALLYQAAEMLDPKARGWQ